MTRINVLGISESQRQALVERAQRDLAAGDETLARELLVVAAQQLAARVRHHADEALTKLNRMRASVLQSPAPGDSFVES